MTMANGVVRLKSARYFTFSGLTMDAEKQSNSHRTAAIFSKKTVLLKILPIKLVDFLAKMFNLFRL